MSLPRHRAVPPVGLLSPSKQRALVVLPLPLSPTMLRMRGGCSSKRSDTLSTATVGAPVRPPPKIIETLRSSSNGAPVLAAIFGLAPRCRFGEEVASGRLAWLDGQVAASDCARPGCDRAERRLDASTDLHRVRAPRVEAAPGRPAQRTWGYPGYSRQARARSPNFGHRG